MRALTVTDAGSETPLETFARDHLAICRVADASDTATIRVWRAAAAGVSLGRYHRRPEGAVALTRRITGGRPHGVGPGIVCMTGVYPSLDWLAAGHARLLPEQVLNRALRPLLATLRGGGVDAFYPGRDLVTVSGRPLAVASFTALPDGVIVVTAAVAAATSLSETAAAIRQADPEGVVTFDADALANGTTLEELAPGRATIDWAAELAAHAAEAQVCEATVAADVLAPSTDVGPAFDALQGERGAAPAGQSLTYAIDMLGAIEAAARLEGGRIAELTLSGDIIAPFATVEELSAALIGEPPTRAAADRALLEVLARPGRFLLGVRDFPGLVARIRDT